jgi:AcrR family transcriptional regulator
LLTRLPGSPAAFFYSKGVYYAGIEDITQELKLARGTLNQYFISKEYLLEQVLFWNEKQLLRELKQLYIVEFDDKEKIFGEIIRVIIVHRNSFGVLSGTSV